MDELCAITLWHRDHARKGLRQVLIIKEVKRHPPRPRLYDESVIADSKLSEASLIREGDRHTKPGSLLKDSIPMRTWADWDDASPGFVEIDLVGHEGGCDAERIFERIQTTSN